MPHRNTPLFLLLFLTVSYLPALSQVHGCKDPSATNYNPSATISDTSCLYSPVYYVPMMRVNPLDTLVKETSGLQMAGNFLWTFNDGGGASGIYRIDTLTHAILQKVMLEGASNIDWEDIAFDGNYFYIGDFGNNADGARTDLKIYKFPFSAIPSDYVANDSITIPATHIETIAFSYSTQLPVTSSLPNQTEYDCEAMIIVDGKIHLFTKNWVAKNTVHFVIGNTSSGIHSATPVDTLATGFLVTGADITPNGKAIALLGYQTSGFANHFLYLLTDFSNGLFFNGNRRKISLPDAFSMGQAEGICFANNSFGYISNERLSNPPFTIYEKLQAFNTSAFMPMVVLPVNLVEFKAISKNGYHQMTWTFNESPEQAKLMRSVNGNATTELQAFSPSVTGSFLIKAEEGKSCYQLLWKEKNSTTKYSNTVCLSAEKTMGFDQPILYQNGLLSLVYHGSKSDKYFFRLLTTDGKEIKRMHSVISSGVNRINFGSLTNKAAIIQIANEKEQRSFLLQVQ